MNFFVIKKCNKILEDVKNIYNNFKEFIMQHFQFSDT